MSGTADPGSDPGPDPGSPPCPRPGPRLPGPGERWRCAACGNLTRFDVVLTTRAREFRHVDLAGVASVEESTVLDQSVQSVTCRWCGRADAIEHVLRAAAGGT